MSAFATGASLILITVRTKESEATHQLASVTVSVMSHVQNAFATGCILTVQFGAVHPIVTFAAGIREPLLVVFDTLLAQVKV